jgi:hypothetical protein
MPTSIGDNELSTLQTYVNNGDRAGYYNQLDQWGYEYGNLAGAVVDSGFPSGRLANSYLAHTANSAHGVTIDENVASDIGINLMELDFAARSSPNSSTRSGIPLRNEIIQGYHEEVFVNAGLDIYSWTATVPLELAERYPLALQGLGYTGSTPQEAREFMWNYMLEAGDDWLISNASLLYGSPSDSQSLILFMETVADVYGDAGAREWLDNVIDIGLSNPAYILFNIGDAYDPQLCFSGEVPIDMWPLDPTLKSGPDDIYDQDEVRAKVWKKPIELIEVGDIVVSFDDNDNLVPGPVTRTFQNDAKILLDFHGTRVTPGHVYYRPDSKKSYKYETLIDVLHDDGVIKHQDRTLIRAATNVPVDSPRDGFVQAVTQMLNADGTVVQNDAGRIRLGTRFLVGTGKELKSWAVADLIEAGGGVVGDDELIRVDGGEPMPFLWDFGETLPKPEDFVLACSGTTLEDIYKAAEWESQGPRLAAPMMLDRGPVQPLKGAALSAMPRNEPLEFVDHRSLKIAKNESSPATSRQPTDVRLD